MTPRGVAGALGLLAGGAALAGCDGPALPAATAPYEFRLEVGTVDGVARRTFRWPQGSSVHVHVPGPDPASRPSLQEALESGRERWNEAAVFGEVRLESTPDLGRAHAVLVWGDAEPVLSTPSDCVGPVTGAASTRGCISADGASLQVWPRRDGGESRVRLRVTVNVRPDLDAELLRRLVAHELGHVVGILNHSPFPGDLMFPGILDSDRLSAADRATLRTLYQTRPDLVP